MFTVRLEQPNPVDKTLLMFVDLELSDFRATVTRPVFDLDQQDSWVTDDFSSYPLYGTWSVTKQNDLNKDLKPPMVKFTAYRWWASRKRLDILARVDKPGNSPMETVFVAALEDAELAGGSYLAPRGSRTNVGTGYVPRTGYFQAGNAISWRVI